MMSAGAPAPGVALSREAIARVDSTDRLRDMLALPEHLRDALKRVETAFLESWDRPRTGLWSPAWAARRSAACSPGARRRSPARSFAGRASVAAVDDDRHDRADRQLLGQHRGGCSPCYELAGARRPPGWSGDGGRLAEAARRIAYR